MLLSIISNTPAEILLEVAQKTPMHILAKALNFLTKLEGGKCIVDEVMNAHHNGIGVAKGSSNVNVKGKLERIILTYKELVYNPVRYLMELV